MTVKLKFIFKAVLITWAVLWVVFMVRQGKRGQYADLSYFYSHEYGLKVRYLLGDDLADLLRFCNTIIPPGSTYDIYGFERFSIREVRARYYLWPLYRTEKEPEFIIVYGSTGGLPEGYEKFGELEGKGSVYIRKGTV